MKQIRDELSYKHNIKAYKPVHSERDALYWQQRIEKQQPVVHKNKVNPTFSPNRSTVNSTVDLSTSSTVNELQSEGISIFYNSI